LNLERRRRGKGVIVHQRRSQRKEEPALLIADEPTTALDVTIQAQIIEPMKQLQEEFGMAILMITHNLGVIAEICSRVAVRYLGNLVELAGAEELYCNPLHPYTEALLSAVPRTDPDYVTQRMILPGDVPSPADPPPGRKFHPRCRYAQEVCKLENPEWCELSHDHWVACHLADELNLAGIDYD
jgi:peptide/nickel transport system ATP-binding protein